MKSAIRLKIKNVNPFLYKVDLFELQGDQISNENLIEGNLNYSLSMNFEKLDFISIERIGLSVSTDNSDLDTKIAKANLIEDEIKIMQNDFDMNSKQQTSDSLQKIKIGPTNNHYRDKKKLQDLKSEITNVTESKTRIKANEMTLQNGLTNMQSDINEINSVVQAYNQLIYLIYSPIYSATEMKDAIDALLPMPSSSLAALFFQKQNSLNYFITDNLLKVTELKRLDALHWAKDKHIRQKTKCIRISRTSLFHKTRISKNSRATN